VQSDLTVTNLRFNYTTTVATSAPGGTPCTYGVVTPNALLMNVATVNASGSAGTTVNPAILVGSAKRYATIAADFTTSRQAHGTLTVANVCNTADAMTWTATR
jgi:hypothetical protein